MHERGAVDGCYRECTVGYYQGVFYQGTYPYLPVIPTPGAHRTAKSGSWNLDNKTLEAKTVTPRVAKDDTSRPHQIEIPSVAVLVT